MTFVVDVGNWFVHKRHLQMQADSAALAAAQDFSFPCADAPILQNGGGLLRRCLQRADRRHAAESRPPPDQQQDVLQPAVLAGADDTVDGRAVRRRVPSTSSSPRPTCRGTSSRSAGLLGSVSPVVPFINAHARISINQLDTHIRRAARRRARRQSEVGPRLVRRRGLRCVVLGADAADEGRARAAGSWCGTTRPPRCP